MSINEPASSALHEGSGRGLLEFLDYVKAKGLLAGQTADSYKSACSRVLSIDEDDWLDQDVREVVVADQMSRYLRLRGASASPKTLTTYQHRVATSIELYRQFLQDPSGFRGPTARRSSPLRNRASGAPGKPGTNASAEPSQPAAESRSKDAARLITYPFPLSSGAIAYLQLPLGLTRSDVRRLCTYLGSLSTEDPDGTSP